jgi:hypothetical protein
MTSKSVARPKAEASKRIDSLKSTRQSVQTDKPR